MGGSAAVCGHWRTLFSRNYDFKWATWDSAGEWCGELPCLAARFRWKVLQSRKARDQINGARGVSAGDALLQFAILWWACKALQGESCCCALGESPGYIPCECTAWGSQSCDPAWPCCPYLLLQWAARHFSINLECASEAQQQPRVIMVCCSHLHPVGDDPCVIHEQQLLPKLPIKPRCLQQLFQISYLALCSHLWKLPANSSIFINCSSRFSPHISTALTALPWCAWVKHVLPWDTAAQQASWLHPKPEGVEGMVSTTCGSETSAG